MLALRESEVSGGECENLLHSYNLNSCSQRTAGRGGGRKGGVSRLPSLRTFY